MADTTLLKFLETMTAAQAQTLNDLMNWITQLEQVGTPLHSNSHQQSQELKPEQRLNPMAEELHRVQEHLLQSEKMAMLGQMTAGIAHEINNPINFIYGNLPYVEEHLQDLIRVLRSYQTNYPEPSPTVQQVLEQVDLEFILEDLPRSVESIKLGADRIRELCLTLRNFYRLDESEMKPADLHEGLDNSLLLLQNRHRRMIQVVKDYSNLPLVECHINQISQVFMNLLSNAIDALEEVYNSETGSTNHAASVPTIQIHTEQRGDRVLVSITDNGAGIPQDIQNRLFEPFFTTKPIGVGTGLGLSICQQIVTTNHNGQIICCSDPTSGTTFKIELPIQQTQ